MAEEKRDEKEKKRQERKDKVAKSLGRLGIKVKTNERSL